MGFNSGLKGLRRRNLEEFVTVLLVESKGMAWLKWFVTVLIKEAQSTWDLWLAK
jgi:hypothetical protein